MRLAWIGCLAACAVLSASPALAQVRSGAMSHASSYAPTDPMGAGVTVVNRGQALAIECSRIATPGADVRVVMSFDPIKGEAPTGYAAVLITDQSIGGSSVRVRVPDMPDLANHTVSLRVYVTDASGTTACDGGHVRIV